MFTTSRALASLSLVLAFVLQPAASVGGAAARPLAAAQVRTVHSANGPESPSSAAWYNGLIQYSTITNCGSIILGSPWTEYGAGTYVGFLADPNASVPAPGVPYYVHLVIYGMGNSCSGMYAYLELALPANTSLAIDATNKVYCYFDNVPSALPSDCPQVLPASGYNQGAFEIPSSDAAHGNTWPLPQGHGIEIQIPVVSSQAFNNSPLQANVWMLDGNSSPWLHPQEGVYVFSSNPTIIYPSPSTITVTATTAHSQAYLYAHNHTGTGLFELGTDTSYSLLQDPLTITVASSAWVVWDDWGPPPLQPDTLYHWRFSFTANGITSLGADQTFRTAPDGRVTVGQGQPADCSETAFANALATAKEIVFDCGALPITITLSSPRSINSNLTIDGGNKVTLSTSGTGNHFDVPAGMHLTLTRITLVNGANNGTCGGSIHVLANGWLTLNETRLIGNHAADQGGALCNFGRADITDTLFKGNTSSSHGGAIGNYGSLSLTHSKLVSNTASANGGGIDTTVALTVTTSTFLSNTAGYRGGGINNYLGTLAIVGSSFISNTSHIYGGGLANDAGPSAVSSSTFSDNHGPSGGAIESSGALTLTNSTLSANRVDTNGGGLEWAGGVMTLLNDTIVSNTAGVQGGNIFVGVAPTSSIALKNTLVAFGGPNNCDSTVATQGYNLENANTCGLSNVADRRNANPRIGPLQDNGGSTWTHALQPGSPAIDAGTSSGCPATDQRGTPRPLGGCDIGAYEYGAKITQTIAFGPLANKKFGDPSFTVSATASSGLAVTFTAVGPCNVSGGTVTLTGSGSCTVTAHQAGNSNYNAALDVPQSFTISTSGSRLYLPLIVR